jgi:glutathione S-transferase
MLRDGQGVPAGLVAQTAIPRIPALQHGTFWLTESMAIVEYLEAMFPPPDHARMFPADPQQLARARQIMMWLRADLWALRTERPWQDAVYTIERPPLSPLAQKEANELVDLTVRLADRGELDSWNISHGDLAFALMRVERESLPKPARRFLELNLVRPSLRAYLDHARPPYPPPAPRS